MNQKRPEDIDVSENVNMSEKLIGSFEKIFVRLGVNTVKIVAAVLLAVITGVKFIALEIAGLLMLILKGVRWFFRGLTESIRFRTKRNKELLAAVRKAKKKSRAAYFKSIVRFAGSFLFGEDGICYTAFNYMLPIVSAAFLIGVIRFGSGIEYGIAVEYNGKEIGIISAEADFEQAEREVQQRILYSENDKTVDLSANFSLKIISDGDRILSADQLANEMLEASDEELTEAFGIYIDGKFIGAVKDKDAIQDALDERLVNYHVDGIVRDVSYKNKIEYTKGIYLASSVKEQQETIDMLTSSTEKKGVYIAKSGDSIVSICQKYNMSIEDFNSLNPNAENGINGGNMINVIETESYLPIQYVRELETLSLLNYETVEVETSSLNVGMRSILVKGELGERVSNIEITYVDGIEYARKTVSSEITKEPVVEQIGIGTYSAHPDEGVRELYGSGEFGWPVDGGWISDTFISDRNHKGLDIAAPGGTDIYAAADGVVISAGWNPGGYGYFVQIDHLNGYQTVYGHMSTVFAVEGQTVTRGQLIGAVGTTGNSSGDHCHFEVRYMGICYDPELFINTVEPYIEDTSGGDDE